MSEQIELPHIDRIDYVGGSYPMASKPDGEYVEYDDHVAIVRQLAEQRAELLADVERYRWLQMQTPYRFKKIQDAAAPGRDDDVRYFFKEVFDSAVDAAIANATQQRNATGGEG